MKAIALPEEQQRVLSRREILSGLVMLSAAGVAALRKPDIPLNYLGNRKLDEVIPTRIGRWSFVASSGIVVPPQDQLQKILYSELLTRVYSDGTSPPIMLLIAYSASQTGFLQVHRPEFCYTAAGYSLSDFARHPVPLGRGLSFRANSLTASRDESDETLIYWIRIGDRIPLSWSQQRLDFAIENLRGVIPDSALVRVSMVSADNASAMASMDAFIRAMVESVPAAMRRVLVPATLSPRP